MKKILIPVDGSDFSMRAVEKGAEIAKEMNSEIVLLNAVERVTFDEDEKENELVASKHLKRRSEKALAKGKAILDNLNISNVTMVSEVADADDAIVDYADKHAMDLVIMGSQGLNAGKIKAIFVGSVTRKVIYQCDIPILIVK